VLRRPIPPGVGRCIGRAPASRSQRWQLGDEVGLIGAALLRAFRNNDPDRFTRTKKMILDICDAMVDAISTGEPYRTVLDPGDGEPVDPYQPVVAW